MQELNDFYNAGFGWICRHCERELKPRSDGSRSRWWREGEAESKQPEMSNPALAKWTDKLRTTLICPRCGISESADKS
ncbi:MAG: hypothetical protein ACRD43_10810 [Pyrinomonadaceae bacterium]